MKWLARQCDILIIDEPTRGIDVGAKAEIHHLLDELACQGLAVWLISSELPELMNLSRRIIVLREGKLMGEAQRPGFSQAGLMRLMAGMDAEENSTSQQVISLTPAVLGRTSAGCPVNSTKANRES